ncbi:MAG: HU family DNA-binding protein [Mariprofundaceae bacterium]|nr:HU family DNA-binding protein [Mariprofundaceae bacterium]
MGSNDYSSLHQTQLAGEKMNKAELIDHVAANADLSKVAAGAAVEAVLGGIAGALSNGGSVSLVGFGTFSVADRAARTARNPRTGEAIQVAASKAPKFKAGKALKDAVK